jgi:hypothetical protein
MGRRLRTVAVALQHAEICSPWAYCVAVLVRHDPRYLVQVSEVMHRPRCQKLRQRNCSEVRVEPAKRKVRRLESEPAQFAQVLRPQLGKLIQKLAERLALALPRLGEAIESVERSALSELQDHLRPRHPVGALAMDEMTDNIECAPGIRAFIVRRPLVGKVPQKRIQGCRRALEERYGLVQAMRHDEFRFRENSIVAYTFRTMDRQKGRGRLACVPLVLRECGG